MSKKLQAFYVIWYREVLIYLRNSLKFFTSIFLPLLILVFFGTGLKAIFTASVFHYDFEQFLFPGILTLSVSVMAISSTMSIVWDREFGFLKEIFVSPISRNYIALGKILGAATTALLQGTLILLTMPYLGIHFNQMTFLKTILVIFLIGYGMAALGIFFASRLKKIESFSILSQIIIAPMAFLSGAFFPLKNAPVWMTVLARYNPLTYGVDALRWVILSHSLPAEEIMLMTTHSLTYCVIFLLIFNVAITILGMRMFKRLN